MEKGEWDDLIDIDGKLRDEVIISNMTGKQYNKLMKDHVQNAKKEVFDDIEKLKLNYQGSHKLIDEEDFQRLKERHLSTLPK